jgi:hypothetical protein
MRRVCSIGSVCGSTNPAAKLMRSGFASADAMRKLIGCSPLRLARWLRVIGGDWVAVVSMSIYCR